MPLQGGTRFAVWLGGTAIDDDDDDDDVGRR